MQSIVFYSWQSDLPNSTNRGFILKALEGAAQTLRADDALDVGPVIDRDTAGIPGSPDISATIFEKIDQADVVVCDVSIINQMAIGFINDCVANGVLTEAIETRPTPNPNVLLELGYALKAKGPERLLLVHNTAFGAVESLPFDLRMRRVIRYVMPVEAEERASERAKLQGILTDGLRTILERLDKALPGEPVLAAQGVPTDSRTPTDDRPSWLEAVSTVFLPLNVPNDKHPPFVMIALTPAVPIKPVSPTTARDEAFSSLGLRAFLARGRLYREPSGVALLYEDSGPEGAAAPMALAYYDGTVSMRVALYPHQFWPDGRKAPFRVDLVSVWKSLREMLQAAVEWPRLQCGCDGSLWCRFGVGNIAEAYGVVEDRIMRRLTHELPSEVVANRRPGWQFDKEWNTDVEADDLIEAALGPLARQLQFPYYDEVKAWMRSVAVQ